MASYISCQTIYPLPKKSWPRRGSVLLHHGQGWVCRGQPKEIALSPQTPRWPSIPQRCLSASPFQHISFWQQSSGFTRRGAPRALSCLGFLRADLLNWRCFYCSFYCRQIEPSSAFLGQQHHLQPAPTSAACFCREYLPSFHLQLRKKKKKKSQIIQIIYSCSGRKRK